MTIVHSKNSTIGYDTVNKCVASVRTPENTSYETMIKICIDNLKQLTKKGNYEQRTKTNQKKNRSSI
jgi:hypothetical protein